MSLMIMLYVLLAVFFFGFNLSDDIHKGGGHYFSCFALAVVWPVQLVVAICSPAWCIMTEGNSDEDDITYDDFYPKEGGQALRTTASDVDVNVMSSLTEGETER